MTGSDTDAVAIGIDFGTLSGRVVVASVADGRELASAEHVYRHGAIEERLPGTDERLPRSWALQSPDDWRDVLRHAVPEALAAAGVSADRVIGVATDFTACTVLPTTADGTPLSELDELAARPHAWPKLWKHHAAQPQADRINALAAERGETWLSRYGGKISSEWEFAKGLQVLEEDPEVYARADRWIEAADWIVWQLCGEETRNVCTAGYKGIYQDGKRPSSDYLAALNPGFADFCDKLDFPLSALGDRAGGLSAEAAAWTGLNEGTTVAIGNVDAHVTAASAKAVGPGQLVAIMGTSTCHVVNGEQLTEAPGMCGVVRDGITPGLWGYEAGQSGVGDIFAWFTRTAVPGEYVAEAAERGLSVHEYLTDLAAGQAVGEHGLVALDWQSGNRSVLVDHDLSGVIVGLTLATRPEEIYRALVEATAFGTRVIVETLVESGVPIDEFVAAGGLLKNKWLMQTYADVLRRPITVLTSEQGPALGSAIHAAVAAGAYPDIQAASEAMGKVERAAYTPDEARADAYDELYAIYAELHDHFGRGGSDALHKLHRIANEAGR
ncbi:ribulokinase [Glycomyces arizonensis]|uniref:ribulokinase n=1 Tax=Glycomyces arizonensis TaxID=256035 RepID=UPI0003F53CD7|nr:ribulokinase [Glycomyces arizonensis]